MPQLPTPNETMIDIEKLLWSLQYPAWYLHHEKIDAAFKRSKDNGKIAAQTILRLQSELAAANARAEGEYARGWFVNTYAGQPQSFWATEKEAADQLGYKETTIYVQETIRNPLQNSKEEPHEAI